MTSVELDQEAWERWKTYRALIRKPIKPASEAAMKLKLQRYGVDQAAVVEQSISNQWQGLFELKDRPKGEKPKKSAEQISADNAAFERQKEVTIRHWDRLEATAINRLKLCEALWARYTIDPDSYTPDRMEWLREAIALHIREAKASEVLGEPGLATMVWVFFGERGFNRLKERARGESETANG